MKRGNWVWKPACFANPPLIIIATAIAMPLKSRRVRVLPFNAKASPKKVHAVSTGPVLEMDTVFNISRKTDQASYWSFLGVTFMVRFILIRTGTFRFSTPISPLKLVLLVPLIKSPVEISTS